VTSRRRFLVRLAAFGGVGIGSLLAACSAPAPNAAPTSAPATTAPAAAPATQVPRPTIAPAPVVSSGSPAPSPAVAAAPSPVAAGNYGGQANVAIFGSAGVLLADFTTTSFAITLTQCAFDSLLKYDSKLQFQPKLATSWTISPDGTVYSFQLRPNVLWSDGQPLTAADVEATILALTDPRTTTQWISYVDQIVGATDRKAGKRSDLPGVSVLDDHTLQITTIQPTAVFLDLFGTEFMVLPKHVLDTIPMDQLNKSPFASVPNVSSGPFVVSNVAADQFVELDRNPNYWGGKPYLDKVFFKFMDSSTAVAALLRGDLDIIPGEISGELPPGDANSLKGQSGYTVTSYPNNTSETFYENMKTLYGDTQVRQAMMYAMDRPTIVDQVLLGYGEIAYSVYPSFSPYYIDSLNKYEYDPDKAKQMLQQAGWDSSKTADFVLATDDATRTQLGTVLQQYLQAVGIQSNIDRTDFATMVNRLTQTHNFDLSVAENRGFNNLDLSRRFASNMYSAGVNASGYANPQLDEIMNEARAQVTFDKQKPYTDQIQQILNDDAPVLLTYYRDSIGAVNTQKLAGATPHYLGAHRDIATWYLR
jgi:peptide/nickel transport system substrate-binding protein